MRVNISAETVYNFRKSWPCSGLPSDVGCTAEFAPNGDLTDFAWDDGQDYWDAETSGALAALLAKVAQSGRFESGQRAVVSMSRRSVSIARFVHDCPRCTYLGETKNADLYHCVQAGGIPTLIARFSSDGPDYVSGVEFADRIPELTEARRLAVIVGLPLTIPPLTPDREDRDR